MFHSRIATALLMIVLLPGCAGTAISVATDAAIETAKIPFKVGKAVVDVATGDEEEEDDDQ